MGGLRTRAREPWKVLGDGEAIVRKALFVQHCDYPDQGWLDQQVATDPQYVDLINAEQGLSKGWWYVTEGNRPTYWERPRKVYVYDGSRWRKQRYEQVLVSGSTCDKSLDDVSIPNPDHDYDILIVLVLIAMRWPIINVLAGWIIVFPLVTIAGGSIVWSILIQRWDELFSFRGYGTTLAVFAVPVALWVLRLNRS